MAASGSGIATWSTCSPCSGSATRFRSTATATKRSHEFSADRQFGPSWLMRRARVRTTLDKKNHRTRLDSGIKNYESQEDIMQMAITFMAVVAGMIFSLSVALLAEELIFGQ